MKDKIVAALIGFVIITGNSFAQTSDRKGDEKYRPQFHFSPEKKWMNDPNGMVYYKGVYNLFYQFYPDSTVWGPMHWAHATSKDLVHWEDQPIALYPDSLGYIFSGSAVVDLHNSSGFGKDGKVPLVAIFTHHNMDGEKAGKNDFQNQSIAYSLDDGTTWIKYQGNPVLKNPGIKDFRDPKVMWFEEGKKWIMTLATKDRVTFYSSPDLKNWTRESDLGSDFGAHGGVWECPDLFPLDFNGKKTWVLLVSINPGGPNGGSATQYFTGDFDGKTFKPHSTETKWIDHGTDNYAGITWSNTGNRKIFIGWMNNWQYANIVPTEAWRGAATLPRELSLTQVNGKLYLKSNPVKELDKIMDLSFSKENFAINSELDLSKELDTSKGQFKLDISFAGTDGFSINVSNENGEELTLGYEKASNQYFIDRTKAGKSDFEPGFAKRHTAARISNSKNIKLSLIVDHASAEVFADNGLNVFTDIFFPESLPGSLKIITKETVKVNKLQLSKIKSIWHK
jgi:fructan beta-fructosidase